MPRKPRTLRLEALEQRNMFNGGPVFEDYVLPEIFNARDDYSPSEQLFYLDAVNVPTYGDLQDESRFELLWGQSHDNEDAGVEVGFYLGGTRYQSQRQVFMGMRHVYKDTGQESFQVHDYGSVIPTVLSEQLAVAEPNEPLSIDHVKSTWDDMGPILEGYFQYLDNYFETNLPAHIESSNYLNKGDLIKDSRLGATVFRWFGRALKVGDVLVWHAGKERAIQYGADLATPVGHHDYPYNDSNYDWFIAKSGSWFDVTTTWNHANPNSEREAEEAKFRVIREIAARDADGNELVAPDQEGRMVPYRLIRYRLQEIVRFVSPSGLESTTAIRNLSALVDIQPLPDAITQQLARVMEDSVANHHRGFLDRADEDFLRTAYERGRKGDTIDPRVVMTNLIDGVRRKDYDLGITHAFASILEAQFLDRELIWSAWDRPVMQIQPDVTYQGIEGQELWKLPDLVSPEEVFKYIAGEPAPTAAQPPRDTMPPPRPNIFIASPTTVYEPKIIVSGYTEPGALVRVVEHQHGTNEDFENAVPFSSGEADEHGRFNIHLPLVADAANVFSFAAEDGAGNISDSVKTPPIFYRESPEGLRELLPQLISEQRFNATNLQQTLKKHDLAQVTYLQPRTWPSGAPVQYETDQHWHYNKPSISYYTLTDQKTDATSHILELTLEHSSYDRDAQRQIAAFDSSVLINIGEFPTNDGKLTLDSRLLDFNVLTQLATPEDAAFEAIVDSGQAWRLLDDFVTKYVELLDESGVTPVWISEPIDRSRIGEGPGVEAIVDRKDYRTGASNHTRLLGASDHIVLIGHDGGRIEAYDTRTEQYEELRPTYADFDPENVFTYYASFGNVFLPVNEKLVFMAPSFADDIDPDLGRGRNLGTGIWSTDGTLEGTRMLANLTTLDDEGEAVFEAPCGALGIRNPFYYNYYCGESGRAQTEPTNFVKGAEGLYFVQFRDMEHTLRDGIRPSGEIVAGKWFDVYFTDGDSVTKIMSQDFDGGRFYFSQMVSNEQGSVFLGAQQSAGDGYGNAQVTFQLTPNGARPIYEGSMLWAVGDVAYYSSVPSRPPELRSLSTGEPVALPFTKYGASNRGDVVEVTSYDAETRQEKVFLTGDGSLVDLPEFPNSSALKIAVVDGEYYLSTRPLQRLVGGEWQIVADQGPSQRHGSLLYNPYQIFTPNRIALQQDSTFQNQQLFESDSYLYAETGGIVYRIDAGLADVQPSRIDVPEVQIDFLPPADDIYVHSHEDIPITIKARYGEDGVTVTKFSLDLPDDLIQSSLFGTLDSFYASQGDFIIARHFPGRAGELFVEFWRVDFENSVLTYLPTPEPYAPFRGVYDRIREDGFYVWYREQDQFWKLEGDRFVVVDSIPDESTESVPHYLGFDVPQDAQQRMRTLRGDSSTSLAQLYEGNLTFLLFTESADQQAPVVQITSARPSTQQQNSIVVSGTTEPGTMLVSPRVGQTTTDVFFNTSFRRGSSWVVTADDDGHFEITISLPKENGFNSGNLLAYGTNGAVTQLEASTWAEFLETPPRSDNKLDTNNDGTVAPIDALLIINELNAKGAYPISSVDQPGERALLDVNGDGFVSPLDVLMIINHLHRQTIAAEGEADLPRAFTPPTVEYFRDSESREDSATHSVTELQQFLQDQPSAAQYTARSSAGTGAAPAKRVALLETDDLLELIATDVAINKPLG
ncbi:MAG: hypothetical protein H6821_06850 [Planctomycetaceae bacterium]|nr:hypothetical protein [Planctomycetaceae bacterium]